MSNSSFQAGRGSAAWIIEGQDNSNRLIGTCLSLGNNHGHSLFRSELARIYAMLFTLKLLLLNRKKANALACLQWKTSIVQAKMALLDQPTGATCRSLLCNQNADTAYRCFGQIPPHKRSPRLKQLLTIHVRCNIEYWGQSPCPDKAQIIHIGPS